MPLLLVRAANRGNGDVPHFHPLSGWATPGADPPLLRLRKQRPLAPARGPRGTICRRPGRMRSRRASARFQARDPAAGKPAGISIGQNYFLSTMATWPTSASEATNQLPAQAGRRRAQTGAGKLTSSKPQQLIQAGLLSACTHRVSYDAASPRASFVLGNLGCAMPTTDGSGGTSRFPRFVARTNRERQRNVTGCKCSRRQRHT